MIFNARHGHPLVTAPRVLSREEELPLQALAEHALGQVLYSTSTLTLITCRFYSLKIQNEIISDRSSLCDSQCRVIIYREVGVDLPQVSAQAVSARTRTVRSTIRTSVRVCVLLRLIFPVGLLLAWADLVSGGFASCLLKQLQFPAGRVWSRSSHSGDGSSSCSSSSSSQRDGFGLAQAALGRVFLLLNRIL